MKIYTGNFANIKKYKAQGLCTVSIARFNRYYSGETMISLAPPSWMIHLPEREYVPNYKKEVLDRLNPANIVKQIEQQFNGKDVILLCYEKAGDFCHRRLVAEWLEKALGIKVEEFSTVSKKEAVQATMF